MLLRPDTVIVINDSNNIVECPNCNNDVHKKKLTKTCSINGHEICIECDKKLKEANYNNCIYCGSRKTIIEVPAQNPQLNQYRPVIVNRNRNNHCTFIHICCALTFGTCGILLLYIFGNLIWMIGQVIFEPNKKFEEHSFRNCILGILLWFVFAYISATSIMLCDVFYIKTCQPCYKKCRSFIH